MNRKEKTVKKSLWILALSVSVLAFASAQAAEAATACFDWSCTTSGFCSFDASCSSASPYVWKYNFNFGDGSGTGLTGDPTWDHDYTTSGPPYPSVTLTIYFFSEPSSQSVTCDIVARNVVGPPLPQSGRCSSSS